MVRKSFDRWKIQNTAFNKNLTFYVECDCGELAERAYLKYYFQCLDCGKKYVQKYGEYVEMKQSDG
ncbi:transcriptional regulator [Enterococcus termitis]|uniref:Transcriptional regulator n=1 Tax=Enterococcus termitis TaxID=332950 RepID=A0A1E5GJK0_9ENTE|nr:transcriptional regulator [Enterococcus termitis]